MKKSKKFALNLLDFIKGGIVSAGTGALTATISALNTGSLLAIDPKLVAIASCTSLLAYLGKQVFTDEKGDLK